MIPKPTCLYCTYPHWALGLCHFHWQRWYKRTPMEGPRYANRLRKRGWVQAGYRWIMVDGREVREHRHVMEQHLGRALHVDECVHHRNGDKLDNCPENLEVIGRAPHTSHHREHGPYSYICPVCSCIFWRKQRYRQRCCSQQCGSIQMWRMRRVA